MNIVTEVTPTVLWHEAVVEAEQSCAIALREEIESYLVFLLMRYTNKPDFVKQIIALDFMEGMQSSKARRELVLQATGDKCLLFAGLFPDLAETRQVRLSYFVKMGQASYIRISRRNDDLYDHLSNQFVPLMDVLQSIRKHSPDLMPLQAYELWNETGSQRALSILRRYTRTKDAF